MSLFGKLDAEKIATNPFFVEKGEYEAEVTKAFYKDRNNDTRQLVIEYTITNEDSQFYDSKVSSYFNLVDPDMTEEAFSLLPADEQKKIRQTNAAIKRTLCGNDANSSQKGLGVHPDDLNDPEWTPESVVGTKVTIGIANYGANNEGVNVRWVNIMTP